MFVLELEARLDGRSANIIARVGGRRSMGGGQKGRVILEASDGSKTYVEFRNVLGKRDGKRNGCSNHSLL